MKISSFCIEFYTIHHLLMALQRAILQTKAAKVNYEAIGQSIDGLPDSAVCTTIMCHFIYKELPCSDQRAIMICRLCILLSWIVERTVIKIMF